jgi:hypothetical protein
MEFTNVRNGFPGFIKVRYVRKTLNAILGVRNCEVKLRVSL